MKKYILILSGGLILNASAQNSIPNGNFELWNTSTYDYPMYYPYTSNPETFYQCQTPFNVVKTTDSYQGTYAIQLTTTAAGGDTCMAVVTNTSSPGSNFPNWPGGIAYTQKPTGIRGYYKSSILPGDTAFMAVIFKLSGSVIGTYFVFLTGTQTSYTLFSTAFNPVLPSNPDTIIFVATSGNPMNNVAPPPGSTIKLDSISFTGVTSQPALMNGDFELWQSQTLYDPLNWYINSWNGQGIAQTTDAAAGNYAMELITYQNDNNGSPIASAGSVSTAYWDNSCSCQKGGYPFTNQIDTLAFYYKYAPVNAGDSSLVGLNFKNNGINVWNTGMYLAASASYQYVEIPFNTGQTIDSVIVSAQSSDWDDSLLVSVGDDFKIDELHFKSQPLFTGVFEYRNDDKLILYPNPCKNVFSIFIKDAQLSGLSPHSRDIEKITIYDVLGNTVESRTCGNNFTRFAETFDISKFPSGLYLIQVNAKSGIYLGKLHKAE